MIYFDATNPSSMLSYFQIRLRNFILLFGFKVQFRVLIWKDGFPVKKSTNKYEYKPAVVVPVDR